MDKKKSNGKLQNEALPGKVNHEKNRGEGSTWRRVSKDSPVLLLDWFDSSEKITFTCEFHQEIVTLRSVSLMAPAYLHAAGAGLEQPTFWTCLCF